jgi:AraC-like DNA-binding protein
MRYVQSDVPLVVFPRLPVRITQAGCPAVLAGPNVATLYNPGGAFRREPRDPRGDEYLELRLQPALCGELEGLTSRMRGGRMRATHAPASRAIYLHQYRLAQHLHDGEPDPLFVEESAAWIVATVLADAHEQRRHRGTQAAHHELAEAAKEVIGARLSERLGLEEIARLVCGGSPTHLARIFRCETGFGLHEYRVQLRLRTALQRLQDSVGSLTSLAFELGFASHSHFTVSFRREFGVPPSLLLDDPDAAWRIIGNARPLAA